MLHFQILFLDIGGPEMMLIMVAALLLFGGQKLPELARGLGKGIRDFKDAANGVKDDLQDSMTKLQEEHANITNGLNIVDSHNQPYNSLTQPADNSGLPLAGHVSEAILVDEHNQPLSSSVHNPALGEVPAILTSSHVSENPVVKPLITPVGSDSVQYSAHAAVFAPEPALSKETQPEHTHLIELVQTLKPADQSVKTDQADTAGHINNPA